MKRPPRFLIPELRSSQRHSRALSEEERVLWESVAKQIKPLRKKSRVKTPETASSGREVGTAKSAAMKKAAVPRAARPTPPPLVPLGRRERSKLLRGRSDIEARLDLHGMTQAHAHRALSVFLQRASRWPHLRPRHHRQGQDGLGDRARRTAPPSAAMAEPTGIPRARGRI